jgi:hypothetical protein
MIAPAKAAASAGPVKQNKKKQTEFIRGCSIIHQVVVRLLTECVVPIGSCQSQGMRKVSTALILLLAVVDVCRCDRDSCDIDDPTLKKLCRKVESQEKYQEKWVATNFKAEMVIMLNSNFVNDRLFPFFLSFKCLGCFICCN